MALVRIVRTIMAVLLAIAVAAMPAAAGAMSAAGVARDAAATAQSMPVDCAHHHAPADRGSKGGHDGAGFAACAAHCFTYVGTLVPAVAILLKASPLEPLVDTGRIASNTAAPPFRPPRI
jgi:hypothetical protein